MNRIGRIVVVAGLFAATACYHYVPAAPEMARQGTPVRARLQNISAFELAQITVNNVDRVDGEMVRVDGGDLVLSATWLQAITGDGYPGNGWTVRIPASNMAGFEQRRISWWRTGLVAAGLVAGTWLGFEALGVGPAGTASGGSPGPID